MSAVVPVFVRAEIARALRVRESDIGGVVILAETPMGIGVLHDCESHQAMHEVLRALAAGPPPTDPAEVI